MAPDSAAATTALAAYFAELDARFPTGFDAGAVTETDVVAMTPPRGVFLVAMTADGMVAGCGGVQRHDADTAEIKRMWIDTASRGAGVGRRLLAELEAESRRMGYARVVLDTNATLVEAIAMYESAGYRPTERYNDNPYAQRWFVKELTRG